MYIYTVVANDKSYKVKADSVEIKQGTLTLKISGEIVGLFKLFTSYTRVDERHVDGLFSLGEPVANECISERLESMGFNLNVKQMKALMGEVAFHVVTPPKML